MPDNLGEMFDHETPQQYMANHPITMEFIKLGLTEEQLASMRFRERDRNAPFDQRSFTWGSGVPMEAIPFIKAYSTLKWLILDDPPASRDTQDAWRYLTDAMVAPIVVTGLKHREAQKRRARRPRVKLTDDGETIRQIVERLARNPEHREESAAQLWPHFFAELDRLGLEPEERTHPDPRKQHCAYVFGDNERKISYGQFANLVSAIRNGNSG